MGGLAFLSPLFLVGALAAAVPIILHLLRREEAPPLAFSAVRFLRRAPIEHSRRKRLREWLLLALRVSALVLLALSFARPFLTDEGAAAASGTTVIAVDTSFSMGAPGRFDDARSRAMEALAAAPAAGLVSVIAFADTADVVVEPTTDHGAVRAALDALEAGAGGTSYGRLLDRAAAVIGERQGRLVIVSDLQASGWRRDERGALSEGTEIELLPVEPPEGNLAVVGVRREGEQLVATILNTALEARTARVALSVDDKPHAESSVDVPAEGSTDVIFDGPLEGALAIGIDDPTGLVADNVRYVAPDPSGRTPVLLVGSGQANVDIYAEKALLVSDEERGFDVTTTTPAESAPMLSAARRPAAVVLLSTRELDRAGRDALAAYVRSGGGLVIVTGPELEPAVVTGLFAGDAVPAVAAVDESAVLRLVPEDLRHPIFRAFGVLAGNLGQVRFERRTKIDESAGGIVARFDDGSPALVEGRAGTGRILVFASDFGNRWNNFPLHPTFVPFLHEAVRYVAGDEPATAEYLVAEAPSDVPGVPGVVESVALGRRIALNVDPRESSTSVLATDAFEREIARLGGATASRVETSARKREAEQSYWRYGLMLMLAALAFEGLVGRRAT